MARPQKRGVEVRKMGKVTEVSFWGVVNGVSQRLHTERLVNPAPEDIAVLAETKLKELRTPK